MGCPKVSVIMPVYNAEKFIRETIESILGQSFTDFEFLIIDDGSTDKSYEIVNSYTDVRIKIFKNRKNLGYVATLNKLIDLSSGEYIARQDNDDISHPRRLERQVIFLDNHLDVGVCGTNLKMFGKESKSIKMPISDEEVRICMIVNNPICHPTVMLRRSLFSNMVVNKYNESLCPAEDYYLWFEISKYTKLANLPESLLRYRWHGENTSQLKKNVQIEKANETRKSILEYYLHFLVSDEENHLLSLIHFSETIDYKCLIKLEALLIKIIHKNKEIGYYNHKVLQNLFFKSWTKLCFKTSGIKFSRKLVIYFYSTLFNYTAFFDYVFFKPIDIFLKRFGTFKRSFANYNSK